MAEGVVLLHDLAGQSFQFDPGAPSLAWALSGGGGYRAVFEVLHAPEDLPAWTKTSLGIEVENVSANDLAEAKRLRAAIWRCADARVDGEPLPRGYVREINHFASRPPPVPQIGRGGERRWVQPVAARQVLSMVARDAVDLCTGPTAGRIRRCTGTNCSLIFVDKSRPGNRRWCSMDRCGNRAKVNAFRNRATRN